MLPPKHLLPFHKCRLAVPVRNKNPCLGKPRGDKIGKPSFSLQVAISDRSRGLDLCHAVIRQYVGPRQNGPVLQQGTLHKYEKRYALIAGLVFREAVWLVVEFDAIDRINPSLARGTMP